MNVPGPVVLHFETQWCGPCKLLRPRLDQAIKASSSGASVVHIDTDERKDLVKQYRIKKVPTLIVLIDGTEARRHEGLLSVGDIKRLIA